MFFALPSKKKEEEEKYELNAGNPEIDFFDRIGRITAGQTANFWLSLVGSVAHMVLWGLGEDSFGEAAPKGLPPGNNTTCRTGRGGAVSCRAQMDAANSD